jgi:hypothetical protein
MPYRLTALVFPLSLAILILKQKAPTKAFLQAGAISPDTARKAQSINAKGDLTGSLRRGVLIKLDDGEGSTTLPPHRAGRPRRDHEPIQAATAGG